MAIDVGSRLRDYEVVARLKSGGMATLFLARRSGAAGFSRHVAIKVVHPHLAEDPSFLRMFVDEALLSAKIQHPNVVHVEELGEAHGTYFLVMEYVHGSALSTLLAALAREERRLSTELAVHVATKVADGLDAAHELVDEHGRPLGVVHRDVSPQNILVGATGHVKLIDFGIAKAVGQGQRTATGSLKGKVRYMSPEQARGQPIDRRTDIYALGIVLWEMLTMQRLFRGENDLALLDEVRDPKIVAPSALGIEVPPALDRVVLSALAKDPDHRPRTARELRQRLFEAVPSAATVGEEELGEVVRAVLGERLSGRASASGLPENVTGLSLARSARGSDFARGEVLRTLTVSAPGARATFDAGASEPSSATPVPVSSPNSGGLSPSASGGTSRLVLASLAGAALASATTAVGVLLVVRGDPSPTPARTATSEEPAVSSSRHPIAAAIHATSAEALDEAPLARERPDATEALDDETSLARERPDVDAGAVERSPSSPRRSSRAGTKTRVRDERTREDGVRRIRAGNITIYDDEP